jgi:hypothetical protein
VYASITVLCVTAIYYILRPVYDPKDGDKENGKKSAKSPASAPIAIAETHSPVSAKASTTDAATTHRASASKVTANDEPDKSGGKSNVAPEATDQEIFMQWWAHSHYVPLLMGFATFVSVTCVLVLYSEIADNLMTSTNRLCDSHNPGTVSIYLGVVIFVFLLIFCAWLMF